MTNQRSSSERDKILVRIDADIADLIPGFLNNRRRDVRVVLDALPRTDFDTIRTLGHRMKGDGGGYGFQAITVMGGALEQAANEKNAGEILRRIAELEDYLERVEVVYD